MHCPQCGQQQIPGEVRFCSRCGFPLDGVSQLVAHGGVLPRQEPQTEQQMSPRRRGVKQGVTLLMLVGIVLTSLFGVFNSYLHTPELFTVLAAIIGFVGGPLRILYALIFEEAAKNYYPAPPNYLPNHMPNTLMSPPRHAALPPQQQSVPTYRQRQHTAEMVSPPSVTENTTRLLDKEPDERER